MLAACSMWNQLPHCAVAESLCRTRLRQIEQHFATVDPSEDRKKNSGLDPVPDWSNYCRSAKTTTLEAKSESEQGRF